MKPFFTVQRVLRKPYRRVFGVLVAATVAISGDVSQAQSAQRSVFVVGNDRGGIIGPRASQIRRLKFSGMRVEIKGKICLSSCTMYLGAGNVCVNPNTQFGFHGPSDFGRPLKRAHFDHWSKILASHYPAAVSTWFMSTGRFKQRGYHSISGAELIRNHGVAQC